MEKDEGVGVLLFGSAVLLDKGGQLFLMLR